MIIIKKLLKLLKKNKFCKQKQPASSYTSVLQTKIRLTLGLKIGFRN